MNWWERVKATISHHTTEQSPPKPNVREVKKRFKRNYTHYMNEYNRWQGDAGHAMFQTVKPGMGTLALQIDADIDILREHDPEFPAVYSKISAH